MIISEEGTKEQLPLSHEAQLNMERCASFVAKMIEKYGRKVLAEIEAEEQAQKQAKEGGMKRIIEQEQTGEQGQNLTETQPEEQATAHKY